jgi:hypothetical protein
MKAFGLLAISDETECPFPITITPKAARVFERDKRSVTFTIKNTLTQPISGELGFDVPSGVTIKPVEFGPIAPGASAKVPVELTVFDMEKGRHTIPYHVRYRSQGAAKDSDTLALPLLVIVGPTLEYVYQHPEPPVYRIQTPNFTLQANMVNGLCRYLADDADAVRLDGSPLFTLSDGKKELLFDGLKHAFTWPRESPADLVAHAQDRCRWQALFFGNRMLIRMDPAWTQFERTYFTLPGKWVSPGGAPRWSRIVAVDGAGKELEAKPGDKIKVSAAELTFPGGQWNLAIKFEPPQEVTFRGTGLSFSIGSLTRDNWQLGFCRPGAFDAWRGKK